MIDEMRKILQGLAILEDLYGRVEIENAYQKISSYQGGEKTMAPNAVSLPLQVLVQLQGDYRQENLDRVYPFWSEGLGLTEFDLLESWVYEGVKFEEEREDETLQSAFEPFEGEEDLVENLLDKDYLEEGSGEEYEDISSSEPEDSKFYFVTEKALSLFTKNMKLLPK